MSLLRLLSRHLASSDKQHIPRKKKRKEKTTPLHYEILHGTNTIRMRSRWQNIGLWWILKSIFLGGDTGVHKVVNVELVLTIDYLANLTMSCYICRHSLDWYENRYVLNCFHVYNIVHSIFILSKIGREPKSWRGKHTTSRDLEKPASGFGTL